MSVGFFGSVPDSGEGNAAAPTGFFKDGEAFESLVVSQDLVQESIDTLTAAEAALADAQALLVETQALLSTIPTDDHIALTAAVFS